MHTLTAYIFKSYYVRTTPTDTNATQMYVYRYSQQYPVENAGVCYFNYLDYINFEARMVQRCMLLTVTSMLYT